MIGAWTTGLSSGAGEAIHTAVRLATVGVVLATAGDRAEAVTFAVTGKYTHNNLSLQYDCRLQNSGNDQGCDGCMFNAYPDPINPFVVEESVECNALQRVYNFYYRWPTELGSIPGNWESFWLFSQKSTVQNTIDACLQNHPYSAAGGDVHCIYYPGGSEVVVEGAYLLGSELSLGSLSPEIDMGQLGEPPIGASDPYDWSELVPYLAEVGQDWELDALWWHPWKKVFVAAMMYYTDADLQGTPVGPGRRPVHSAAGSGEGAEKARSPEQLDKALARKVLAHALVCWQIVDGGGFYDSWGDGQLEIDLLSGNGFPTWPWTPFEENPTFIYWLGRAVEPFVGATIDVEGESWARIKTKYRE